MQKGVQRLRRAGRRTGHQRGWSGRAAGSAPPQARRPLLLTCRPGPLTCPTDHLSLIDGHNRDRLTIMGLLLVNPSPWLAMSAFRQ